MLLQFVAMISIVDLVKLINKEAIQTDDSDAAAACTSKPKSKPDLPLGRVVEI